MFLQCINCNKSNISCLCRNMRISASSLSSNNLVTALFICSIFILFAFSIQNIYCFCNGQWWIYLFPLLFPPKLLSGCLNQPFGKHALWENVYVSTLLKHDDIINIFFVHYNIFSICVTVVVLNVHFRSPQTHKMAPWVKRVSGHRNAFIHVFSKSGLLPTFRATIVNQMHICCTLIVSEKIVLCDHIHRPLLLCYQAAHLVLGPKTENNQNNVCAEYIFIRDCFLFHLFDYHELLQVFIHILPRLLIMKRPQFQPDKET